jgi:hypothetical protein
LLGQIMKRIFPLVLLALTSCSEPSMTQQVKTQARQSDSVWLCDVDTTAGAVGYRSKQVVTTNVTGMQFAAGQLLPVSGPSIEPGTRYGDEALVFLSSRSGAPPVAANYILVFHDGKTGDGMSREAVIRLVQEEHRR